MNTHETRYRLEFDSVDTNVRWPVPEVSAREIRGQRMRSR